MKLLKMMMLGLYIGLCLGCSTTVKVVNLNDSEFYVTEKDGVKFYCMSDYYLNQVLEAKIKQVNP